MKHIKIAISILTALCLSLPVFGQVTKVGTTAAAFLKIANGARSQAMGGAFVSVANDVTALYWNVAGVAQLTSPELSFTHSEWLQEINYDNLAVALPLGSAGVFGVSFTAMTMDEMEQTTELQPEGTGLLFDAGSYSANISFARQLTDKFMIGFTGKYVRENIWNSSASAVGLDVGTLFETPFNGMRLGMSINNFGTKMQMDGDDLLTQVDPDPSRSGNNENISARYLTDRFDMPLVFRVGLSMELVKSEQNRLTVAVDALHPNDNAESMNFGAEYAFNEMFFLRGGYQSLFLEDSEEGFTAGAGIYTRVPGLTFKLDYAYQDFGMLDNVQMFTVRLSF